MGSYPKSPRSGTYVIHSSRNMFPVSYAFSSPKPIFGRTLASVGNTLTVWPRLAHAPQAGWDVTVISRTTWEQDDQYDAAGDNKNGEGHTPLSFDLQ